MVAGSIHSTPRQVLSFFCLSSFCHPGPVIRPVAGKYIFSGHFYVIDVKTDFMKKNIFTCILLGISFFSAGQFVPRPLNYPGVGYWPFYYTITDPGHLWVGTFHESALSYPFAVKTTDGGDTWIFDSIPVGGTAVCASMCGWDNNICFYVYFDMGGTVDPSIWKTMDGGTTWTNMISSQFTGSFINFYHPFSADTGLAMGDPRNGYFEIQRTTNGGSTWTRVPSSAIPAPLSNEMGLNNSFSAVGNSVWFTTNKCRCFRSADRGLTWDVTVIVPGTNLDLGVCFASEQNGVIWNRSAGDNQLVATHDGGVTWDTLSFPYGYIIQDISRVPGFDEGFVVTAHKTYTRVWFTPDMFGTLQVLESDILSNGAVEFYDTTTGWLGGGESGPNEIYKFTGTLMAVRERMKEAVRLSINPNPSSTEALVKSPADAGSRWSALRITDMTGRIVAHIPVSSLTGWINLNPGDYPNGIYLVEAFSNGRPVAHERWVVNH